MENEKNYYIEKVEKPEEVIKRTNGKIALNATFAVAGLLLAGVGFGVIIIRINRVLKCKLITHRRIRVYTH